MTLWISVKDNDFNTIIPCPVPQPEAKRLEYGAGAWNLALKADAETGSLRSAKRVKRLSPSVARTEPSVPHHYDTILEAFTHISMLEENEEGFVSVSGYLTFTGFAQSKIVCATWYVLRERGEARPPILLISLYAYSPLVSNVVGASAWRAPLMDVPHVMRPCPWTRIGPSCAFTVPSL